jgi:hypothetical protein
MMEIRDSSTRMKPAVRFMYGMSKRTLNKNLYITNWNFISIMADIKFALKHLDNNCVKLLFAFKL